MALTRLTNKAAKDAIDPASLGIVVFKSKGYLTDGDVVPSGKTHTIVRVNDKDHLVRFSPLSSGVVSGLTGFDVNIGGIPVKLVKVSKVTLDTQSVDLDSSDVIIPSGEYEAQTITINKGRSLTGEGRDVINQDVGTTLNFSDDGIIIGGQGDYVNDPEVSSLYLKGTGGTGIGLHLSGATSAPVTEATIKRMRIEGFGVGLQSLRSWSNVLEQIRVHNCTKSFEMQSQSNNTSITQLNCSGGSSTSRFVNAEGVHLESFNWVNQTASVSFSLSQSYVTINNPYFENVTGYYLVGATGDVNPSSLSITGGLITGDFVIGKNGSSLYINGSRNSSVPSKVRTTGGLPDRYCTINVNTLSLGDGDAPMNFKQWHLYTDAKENIIWDGASGGSVRFSRLYRDYYEFEQQAAGNGINLTSSLEVGKQYCLVVCMRRHSGVQQLIVKSGTASLQFPDKACPSVDDGGEFVVRHLPFIATATDLELLFTGKIDIKGIAISEGIANSGDVDFIADKPWRSHVPPSQGSWVTGDFVRNTNIAVLGTSPDRYTLSGWERVTTGSGNTLGVDWVESFTKIEM